MTGVRLEVTTKRLTGVAAAHPVRAEGDEQPARHEAGDLLGDDLHEVGDGDDRGVGTTEQLGDEGIRGWLGCSRFHRSAQRLLAQRLVRRRRPQLGADVPVRRQLLGGLQGGALSGAGEQQRDLRAGPRDAPTSGNLRITSLGWTCSGIAGIG